VSEASSAQEQVRLAARVAARAIKQAAERVAMRRGLLGLIAVVLVIAVMASELDLAAGLVAFAISAFVASWIPHQGAASADAEVKALSPHRSDRLQALTDALPDAAIVLNPAGHVNFFNSAARDQFDSLKRGSHISSAIRTPEFLDALNAARSRGRAITVVHAERVPVGRRTAVTVAPLDDADARAESAAMLVLLRDLSEQERVNQMRADFVANASHELRTPLASLRGFIETLQGSARYDEAARERFLGIMASQAERMSRLIDDLLSLSRVEMNAHLPLTARIDLNEVLNHVSDTMEPLARARGQTLNVERLAGGAMVRGDRDELVQLFQNLVQNAVKYGVDGGRADVTIRRLAPSPGAPSIFRIAVADNGPGIAPEHIPRLTERFYRVDVASSRDKGGTGLGLAIVKHVLARHRGELDIESEQGRGSVFTVTLNEAASVRNF
jgi:two-component system phosphate regulon sensor histidine kinase PhoR